MRDKNFLFAFVTILLFTSCSTINNFNNIIKKDKNKNFKYSELHNAVRLNQLNNVKALVNKIDLNKKDKFGDTPLMDAVRNNYTEISKVLICYGAKTKILDMNGNSLLNMAVLNNNNTLVNILTSNNPKKACNSKKTISPSIEKVKTKKNNNYVPDLDSLLVNNVKVNKETSVFKVDKKLKKIISKNLAEKNKKSTNKEFIGKIDEISSYDNKPNKNNYLSKNNTLKEINLENNKNLYVNRYISTNQNISYNKNQLKYINELKDIKLIDVSFDDKNLEFTFVKQNKLSKKLKNNLVLFLPKFINISKQYKNLIKHIRVENHTSSE